MNRHIKVVIRLLPPGLSEDVFFQKLSLIFPDFEDKYYVRGEYPINPYDLPTHSRAYILLQQSRLNDFLQAISEAGSKFVFGDGRLEKIVPKVQMADVEGMVHWPLPDGESIKDKDSSYGSLRKHPAFKQFLLDYKNEATDGKKYVTITKPVADKKKKKKKKKQIPGNNEEPIKNEKNEKKSKNEKKPKKSKPPGAVKNTGPVPGQKIILKKRVISGDSKEIDSGQSGDTLMETIRTTEKPLDIQEPKGELKEPKDLKEPKEPKGLPKKEKKHKAKKPNNKAELDEKPHKKHNKKKGKTSQDTDLSNAGSGDSLDLKPASSKRPNINKQIKKGKRLVSLEKPASDSALETTTSQNKLIPTRPIASYEDIPSFSTTKNRTPEIDVAKAEAVKAKLIQQVAEKAKAARAAKEAATKLEV